MYESFFGLDIDPFRLSTDPRFCFNHPGYSLTLALIPAGEGAVRLGSALK